MCVSHATTQLTAGRTSLSASRIGSPLANRLTTICECSCDRANAGITTLSGSAEANARRAWRCVSDDGQQRLAPQSAHQRHIAHEQRCHANVRGRVEGHRLAVGGKLRGTASLASNASQEHCAATAMRSRRGTHQAERMARSATPAELLNKARKQHSARHAAPLQQLCHRLRHTRSLWGRRQAPRAEYLRVRLARRAANASNGGRCARAARGMSTDCLLPNE